MKEKILEALKNKYKDLGFDAKAFDGVATFLSTTVTEESQIEVMVNNSESMLKSMQGEIDRRVISVSQKKDSEISALQAKLNQPTPPTTHPTPPNPTPTQDEPEWAKKIREQQEAILDMRTKDEQTQKANQLRSQAKAKMIEKGIKDSLCDKLLAKISISDETTVDSLTEIGIKEYNDFKSDFTPEAGSPQNPQPQDIKKFTDDYYARRKIEVEQQNKAIENVK